MSEDQSILLVGAGMIGVRHLQSLITAPRKYELGVYDTAKDSLERANQALSSENIPTDGITFIGRMSEISENYDLAIIATTSDVRARVTLDLLNVTRVSNILFEKVLFQRLNDYDVIEQKLANSGINAWVNCPRRYYPHFKKLREQLIRNPRPIHYTVSGNRWGLACNAIHFIDQVEWLTGETIIAMHCDGLQKDTYPSKRAGFMEIYGKLKLDFSGGSLLTLSCYNEGSPGFKLEIDSGIRRHEFDEGTNVGMIDGISMNEKVRPILQSELTAKIAEQILFTQKCQLVNYHNSARQHRIMVCALLSFFQESCQILLADDCIPVT